MDIDDIRLRLRTGQFEFSRHALKRVVERNISETEIVTVYEPDTDARIDFRMRKRP